MRLRLSIRPAVAAAISALAFAFALRAGSAADLPSAETSQSVVRIVRFSDVEADIVRARSVTLSAYSLAEQSRIVGDLLSAARRGAAVSVALSGSGMGFAVRENLDSAAHLRAGGVRVHVLAQPIHMKAAVIDGARVYVSDRNWTARGSALILALPSAYRLTVERAMEGQASTLGTFTTRKDQSLANEDAVFAAGGPLVVQTESFNALATPVGTLERVARSGRNVTLIVAKSEYYRSARERAQLANLAGEGIAVRISSGDEKIAVGPVWAWCGSTNLSSGVPDQIDWGYATRDPVLVAALRAQVERTAANALPASQPRSTRE